MSESSTEAHEAPKKKASSVPPAAAHAAHDHDHGGDGHHHNAEYPFLAHHFDTPSQQFEAGKLGIWLFLLTEVLFFAGLFCAYTVYRGMRPEVFVYAHYFLDTKLGAVNTCVLLVSSLTAAWAVRNAQLRQQKLLMINIVVTIACACTFMVVKYFEYSHKVHDGLLWGPNFAPKHQVWELPAFKKKHPEAAAYAEKLAEQAKKKAATPASAPASPAPAATAGAADHAQGAQHAAANAARDESIARPTREQIEPLLAAGLIGEKAEQREGVSRPRNAHVFFSIYFFMTGLHGLHVLIGIGIFVWLLIKASKGVFGPYYFGPIDYAALYWHLVDLIWIYLFPLLYLIH
ncbi:MAG TPA: cytochrome c oxidase subunit 3 family protein [Polyangiaceae bacterium]